MINRPHIVQLQCSTSSPFACAAVSFICKINTKDGRKQEERGGRGDCNIDTIFGHRIVPFLHFSFLPSLTRYTVSQSVRRLIPLWHPQRKGSRIDMNSYVTTAAIEYGEGASERTDGAHLEKHSRPLGGSKTVTIVIAGDGPRDDGARCLTRVGVGPSVGRSVCSIFPRKGRSKQAPDDVSDLSAAGCFQFQTNGRSPTDGRTDGRTGHSRFAHPYLGGKRVTTIHPSAAAAAVDQSTFVRWFERK